MLTSAPVTDRGHGSQDRPTESTQTDSIQTEPKQSEPVRAESVSTDPGRSSPAAEPEQRLRDALRSLVRAQKAMRLYQGAGPVSNRLETELHLALTSLIDDEGPIELRVRQFQLWWRDQRVYENRDRRESLAFLLFRDGVRSLTLRPGLDGDELHRLLACFGRMQLTTAGEDDLVTLLWEQDFRCISYVAVDELGDELGGDVAAQLASGSLAPGGVAGGVGGEPGRGGAPAVRLDDVKPLSRLPVEDARLSEAEVESLRKEIAAEEAIDLRALIPDLAAEIASLEPGAAARRQLSLDLLAVVDARLAEGDGETVLVTFNRLADLARTTFDDREEVATLYDDLKRGLAVSARLDRLLAVAREAGGLGAGVQRLLARLPEESQESLVRWLGRFPSAADRRALSDVLLARGERCLPAVSRQLDGFLAAGDEAALGEILYLARELSPGSLPLLQRLLRSKAESVRREAALALGRIQGKRAAVLWLELLDDDDAGLRSLAIAALARSESPAVAREMLARVSGEEPVRSEEEVRRALAAVARLAGADALPWLAALLQPERRRWFGSRREQELARAAAHGIRAVGSQEANELLATLLRDGDRVCRAACAAELEGGP